MGDNEDQEELKPPNFAILDHEEDEAGGDTSPDFKIKPALNDKFQAGKAKEIIRGALEDEFKGKAYDGDQSKNIVKRLSREIKTKIEAITHQNYKIVVEVTLVEQRGAGIRSDVKCIWDADADTLASDVFISVSNQESSMYCFSCENRFECPQMNKIISLLIPNV
uniref:Tctex1 domain-containing protein 2 n=1 Tax=Cacopsylla melanoneura TaxID=428564 RepID=A0A8D8V2C0_9HEMI